MRLPRSIALAGLSPRFFGNHDIILTPNHVRSAAAAGREVVNELGPGSLQFRGRSLHRVHVAVQFGRQCGDERAAALDRVRPAGGGAVRSAILRRGDPDPARVATRGGETLEGPGTAADWVSERSQRKTERLVYPRAARLGAAPPSGRASNFSSGTPASNACRSSSGSNNTPIGFSLNASRSNHS